MLIGTEGQMSAVASLAQPVAIDQLVVAEDNARALSSDTRQRRTDAQSVGPHPQR